MVITRSRHHPYPRCGEASSSRLKKNDRPLAAIGAYANNSTIAGASRGEFLYRLTQDARSGRAEGVTERHTASVGVHALPREGAEVRLDACLVAHEARALPGLDVEQDLGAKGFVDLPQLDIRICQVVA